MLHRLQEVLRYTAFFSRSHSEPIVLIKNKLGAASSPPKLFCVVICRWNRIIDSFPLVWTFSMMELDPCARLGPGGNIFVGTYTCVPYSCADIIAQFKLGVSPLLLRYIVSYTCAYHSFCFRLSICSKCTKEGKEWRGLDSSCNVSAFVERVKVVHHKCGSLTKNNKLHFSPSPPSQSVEPATL